MVKVCNSSISRSVISSLALTKEVVEFRRASDRAGVRGWIESTRGCKRRKRRQWQGRGIEGVFEVGNAEVTGRAGSLCVSAKRGDSIYGHRRTGPFS